MNIALIGLGMVAQTHVAAIKASGQGLTLRGVLGRDPARAQDFARKNNTQAYPSVDALLRDEALDFVILATPPNARAPLIAALNAAQIPVLMEKPVERTLAQATDLVAQCEAAQNPLGIVFQHRMRAASMALKQALTQGELGEIATVEMRVPWWRPQSYYDEPGRGSYARDGGGVMISQAIHTLDLLLWCLGPIDTIQSMMRTTALHDCEAEDWAGALFTLQNGAVGTMMATTAATPGAAETIAIQGTKGHALLGSGMLEIQALNGEKRVFGAASATGGGADPMAFTHAWHQSVIEDFAQALIDKRAPLCTGREALLSHAVIDAMERASASGSLTKVNAP